MPAISHTEHDGESGHVREFLLLDMSSLDLFPSTLVVLARSYERAFFCLKSCLILIAVVIKLNFPALMRQEVISGNDEQKRFQQQK